MNRLSKPAQKGNDRRQALLLCAPASTLLYIAMDRLCACRYEGYSYRDQTISELSAIDAPTRRLWLPLGFLYSALVSAASVGVWSAAAGDRSLRFVAGLLAAMGAIGLLGWPFAPMHKREVLAAGGSTRSDSMHLLLAGANTLIFVLAIVVGARTFGERFRRYSWITFGAVLVAGSQTGKDASKVSANAPTPWLGVMERIAVFCLALRAKSPRQR